MNMHEEGVQKGGPTQQSAALILALTIHNMLAFSCSHSFLKKKEVNKTLRRREALAVF